VERAEPSTELKLLGRTVDEALGELDKFLDAAAVSGLGEVRVVHGHGTGRLRRAVREFLADHVHVRAYRPGKPHEGGDGATVVTLR
jgi:DNA mismatch repair protein MutS2